MDSLKWIMSEGGPLIAMESKFENDWGGVFRLTVPQPGAAHDYDRPPEKLNYLQCIKLQNGEALIFGEGPLDTAFWRSSAGEFFIVRVRYCESNFDAEKTMALADHKIFENPREIMEFNFSTEKLILFDSADDGMHSEKESIATIIAPGRYRILTQVYKPDELTCLILHRCERIA